MELVGTERHWHDVDMATRDLGRLGATVEAHRAQLYDSRKDAADAGGISKDTWARVEAGLGVQLKTYRAVEKALGWGSRSCITVAEGGEPVLVDHPGREPQSSAQPPPMTEESLRSTLFELARERLTAATIGDIDGLVGDFADVARQNGWITDPP